MRLATYPLPSFTILFAVVLSFLLTGCEESITGSPDVIQPTFSSIQQNIFSTSCSSMSCHSTFSQRGGLVLEPGKAYANLVGITSDNDKAKGLKRVNPGKPDSSFLMIKLTGPGPGQGDRMPDGNNPLSDKAITAIRTWIANGAKQD